MLLILSLLAVGASFVAFFLVYWADMMSDAPSQDDISFVLPFWLLVVGLALFVAWWFVGGKPMAW